jgi:hypothetical protein
VTAFAHEEPDEAGAFLGAAPRDAAWVSGVGVLLDSLDGALALGPVAQDHLLQARQMQALSFTAYIPLVCFGIAFPVMVLLMEWWGRRTGDPLCWTIARRWSRVMTGVFAIGAITGTVPHDERPGWFAEDWRPSRATSFRRPSTWPRAAARV